MLLDEIVPFFWRNARAAASWAKVEARRWAGTEQLATYVVNTRAWRMFLKIEERIFSSVWNVGSVGTERTTLTLLTSH